MRNGFNTLIEVVQNDYDYELSFTLRDSNNAVVDISSSAVSFIAQLASDPTVRFTGAMTITDASTGSCKYNVAESDFVVAGIWNAQIRVVYNTGETISFSGIKVTVVAAL